MNKIGKIISLGSSSEGNSLFLELFPNHFGERGFRLLIDVGFQYNELLRRFIKNKITLNEVDCCLVTHEHQDHCGSVRELASRGIGVFAPQSVFKRMNIETQDHFIFKEYEWKEIAKGVSVLPLPMEHFDVDGKIENYGYYIKVDGEINILFATDTKYIPQDLSGIKWDYIFIEANYLEDVVKFAFKDALSTGNSGKITRYKRLLDSHFSLENVARTLTGHISNSAKPYDLSNCKAIFLTHLSSGSNTNESYYREFLTNWLNENKQRTKANEDLKVIIMKKEGGFL